jgi:fructose-bisphosphate aldolase class II
MEPAGDAVPRPVRGFGTAGHASKIKVIPMDEMAARYAAGTLDPQLATTAGCRET